MNVEDRTQDSLKRVEEVIESGNVNGRALYNVIRGIVLKSRLDQIEYIKENGAENTTGNDAHRRDESKDEGSGENQVDSGEVQEVTDPIEIFSEHAKEVTEPKSWEEILRDMKNYFDSPPAIWKRLFGYFKCENCGCERGSNPKKVTKTIPRCPLCNGIMRFCNAQK